jgi:hypothetical protein
MGAPGPAPGSELAGPVEPAGSRPASDVV